MMARSALSVFSILLLVFSLNEAEADAYHRRTRGSTLQKSNRNLGIGLGRTDASTRSEGSKSKQGSKSGGGKSGSKSKGYTPTPSATPVADSIEGRIPVIDVRPGETPRPTSFWFPDNSDANGGNDSGSTEGRLDETTNGENSQTVIDVNDNDDGSNSIPETDEKDDLAEALDNLFGNDSTGDNAGEDTGDDNGDGIISNGDGNGENGRDESDEKKKPPKGAENKDSAEGSSTGTEVTIGDSDSDGNSDAGSDSNVDTEGNSSNGIAGSSQNEDSNSGVGGSTGDETSGQSGESSSEVEGSDGAEAKENGSDGDENGIGESSGESGNNSGSSNDSNQSTGSGLGNDGTAAETDNGASNGAENSNEEVFDPSNIGNSTIGAWGKVPDDGYVPDNSTAVFCPEVSSDKEVLINWIYAVEFQPNMTNEEKSQVVTIMELKLVSEILQCNNQVALPGKLRHRHLLEDGVAGLNYLPLDARNENVVCFFSNSNSTSGGLCETYFGRMEMYLQEDADENIAITSMLYKIRDTMQRNDFPAVEGIVRVWYLDPELSDVDGIAEGDGTTNDGPAAVGYSTGTMIAFAALGISVFAAIVLGAFRMRRNNESDVITNFEQSTITGSAMTPNESYGAKQAGAFVLPNSYKLDAVPEGDDDESRYNGSVIISDGGFTSDGDSQADPSFVANFDDILGSKTEDDDDLNNEMLFQNNTDFSDHRKNNLVTADQVGLGVRHSTVDVHQCSSARCTICNYKPKDVEFIHKSPTTPDVSTGNFFPEDEGNYEDA